jgi:hypothetical protein
VPYSLILKEICRLFKVQATCHIVKSNFALQILLHRTSRAHIICSLVVASGQPPHVSSTLLLRWIKPEPVVRAFFRLLSSFRRSSSGSRRAARFCSRFRPAHRTHAGIVSDALTRAHNFLYNSGLFRIHARGRRTGSACTALRKHLELPGKRGQWTQFKSSRNKKGTAIYLDRS